MRKLSLVLVLVLLVSLSGLALAVEVGEIIPDFTVKDLNGNDVKISDFQGQYVLYDVWATWCGPCKKAMKAYVQNYEQFEKAGIKIVAISVDTKIDAPIKYAADQKLPFTVLHDGEKQAKEHWGVRGIPTMFMVDPEGKVIFKEVGFGDFAELWKQLAETINYREEGTYPTLFSGKYKLESTDVNYGEISANLTISFLSEEEWDFVDQPAVQLVKEPEYANTPIYAALYLEDQLFTMVGVDTQQSGFMDLLYVDYNQNFDLTDDGEPIVMTKYSSYTEIEFPVNVKSENSMSTYLVTCYSYNSENKFYMYNGKGYKGQIKAEIGAINVLLLDADVNGVFTDPVDVLLLDLDGNGLFDSFSSILEWTTLDSVVKLGTKQYQISFDPKSSILYVKKK